MKKNRKEEIQSRREFFKNAAKAALPMLGVALLASNPVVAKAAENAAKSDSASGCWGCGYTCTSCIGSCLSCVGTCTSCTGSCMGSCISCIGTCAGTCVGWAY